MKLFRNPEVVRYLLVYSAISFAAIAAAFCLDTSFGIFTLILCAILLLVSLIATYLRYQKIAELSADINRILHGDNSITLDQYSEGELGILHSELYKMTIRLRENEGRLQEDKKYLADSIADISHQMRTPLTSINLLVSFLSEPELSKERRYMLTRELLGLCSRIDWLITTLLKISKLDAGTVAFKQEQVPLEDLIRGALAPLLVPMELREQTLNIRAEGSFFGDIAWTNEAIGNIVKNCMEHTPQGGTVAITASETALYSEILISDNGTGIAKEDLPHIFERFYKGKNSDEKSFGIGLALARMIIVRQNGMVKAENLPDGGAKFTIRFYKGTV